MLGHFSNALSEMATSLMDLEDGYFKALREVITETERAYGMFPILMPTMSAKWSL